MKRGQALMASVASGNTPSRRRGSYTPSSAAQERMNAIMNAATVDSESRSSPSSSSSTSASATAAASPVPAATSGFQTASGKSFSVSKAAMKRGQALMASVASGSAPSRRRGSYTPSSTAQERMNAIMNAAVDSEARSSPSSSSSTSVSATAAASPVPAATSGFQTASGKSFSVSKAAMKRGQALMASVSSGNTPSRRRGSYTPSSAAQERMDAIMNAAAVDSEALPSPSPSSSTFVSATAAASPVPAATSGFQTASGKSFSVSKAAMKRGQALMASVSSGNTPSRRRGSYTPSSAAQERMDAIMNAAAVDSEALPSPSPSSSTFVSATAAASPVPAATSGFQTASGKSFSVSKAAMKRGQALMASVASGNTPSRRRGSYTPSSAAQERMNAIMNAATVDSESRSSPSSSSSTSVSATAAASPVPAATSGFQTASGKSFSLSKAAMKRGQALVASVASGSEPSRRRGSYTPSSAAQERMDAIMNAAAVDSEALPSPSPSSSTSASATAAASPVPAATSGFRTASGKSFSVSKAAMKRGQALMASVSSGNTPSRRRGSYTPSSAAQERMDAIMNAAAVDSEALPSPPPSSSTSASATAAASPVPAATSGFQTASGKSFSVSKAAMKRGQALMTSMDSTPSAAPPVSSFAVASLSSKRSLAALPLSPRRLTFDLSQPPSTTHPFSSPPSSASPQIPFRPAAVSTTTTVPNQSPSSRYVMRPRTRLSSGLRSPYKRATPASAPTLHYKSRARELSSSIRRNMHPSQILSRCDRLSQDAPAVSPLSDNSVSTLRRTPLRTPRRSNPISRLSTNRSRPGRFKAPRSTPKTLQPPVTPTQGERVPRTPKAKGKNSSSKRTDNPQLTSAFIQRMKEAYDLRLSKLQHARDSGSSITSSSMAGSAFHHVDYQVLRDDYGITDTVLEMTSQSASEFCFSDASLPFANSSSTVDSIDAAGIRHALLAEGAPASFCTQRWVSNHYRWIVWKLASLERKLPSLCAGVMLSVERVLLELGLRLYREYELSHRSCIKRFMEHDDVPSRHMVLVVSRVYSRSEATEIGAHIELTDGWYPIPTVVDEHLLQLIGDGKLICGQKLHLFGATLVGNSEPCSPLENESCGIRLQIHFNSVRRAKWDSRLGIQHTMSFTRAVRMLRPNAGLVPCVHGVVTHVYPMMFMESMPDGTKMVRNTLAWNGTVWHSGVNPYSQSLSQAQSQSQSQSQSPPHSQDDMCLTRRQELIKYQNKHDRCNKDAADSERDVNTFITVQLRELTMGCTETGRDFRLTYWRPNEEILSLLRERQCISIFATIVSGSTTTLMHSTSLTSLSSSRSTAVMKLSDRAKNRFADQIAHAPISTPMPFVLARQLSSSTEFHAVARLIHFRSHKHVHQPVQRLTYSCRDCDLFFITHECTILYIQLCESEQQRFLPANMSCGDVWHCRSLVFSRYDAANDIITAHASRESSVTICRTDSMSTDHTSAIQRVAAKLEHFLDSTSGQEHEMKQHCRVKNLQSPSTVQYGKPLFGIIQLLGGVSVRSTMTWDAQKLLQSYTEAATAKPVSQSDSGPATSFVDWLRSSSFLVMLAIDTASQSMPVIADADTFLQLLEHACCASVSVQTTSIIDMLSELMEDNVGSITDSVSFLKQRRSQALAALRNAIGDQSPASWLLYILSQSSVLDRQTLSMVDEWLGDDSNTTDTVHHKLCERMCLRSPRAQFTPLFEPSRWRSLLLAVRALFFQGDLRLELGPKIQDPRSGAEVASIRAFQSVDSASQLQRLLLSASALTHATLQNLS
jgi:BRCA2, oligonucleotide/oligosaccharide-binding, domain 1/BRCA2, helical